MKVVNRKTLFTTTVTCYIQNKNLSYFNNLQEKILEVSENGHFSKKNLRVLSGGLNAREGKNWALFYVCS